LNECDSLAWKNGVGRRDLTADAPSACRKRRGIKLAWLVGMAIEVVHLFARWQEEVWVSHQVLMEPGRRRLLRTDAEKVGEG
jgi:hypothetical protein